MSTIGDDINAKWQARMVRVHNWLENFVRPGIKMFFDESEDAARALTLAIIFGEDKRAEALNQGGLPTPEQAAFEFGLIAGPILRAYLKDEVMKLLPGLYEKAPAVIVDILKAVLAARG